MDQTRNSLPALSGHRRTCGGVDSNLLPFNLITMKKNMGSTDKIIRIVLALVFAALYFSGTVTGLVGTILLVLGAVFVLTSVVSFCPLYSLVGLSTCPVSERK